MLRGLIKKDVLTHATAWMDVEDVEDVMLSEMSQSQKDNTCVILRR